MESYRSFVRKDGWVTIRLYIDTLYPSVSGFFYIFYLVTLFTFIVIRGIYYTLKKRVYIMKILSAFLLTLMFILTGCGGSSSGSDSNADTSEYLRVSLTSKASTSPVDIEKYVALTFSYTLDETTVDASSVYILDENNVPIAAALRVLGENISIIPNEFFLPNMQYTIVVTTAVEDTLGRTLENTFTYTFITASFTDTLPPSLISFTPADGAEVSKTTDIVMEFNENIAGDGVLQLDEEGAIPTIVNGTTTISNNTLRFVPETDLVQGSNYTVTLQGTVEDLAGNVYSGLTSWNFSVIPASDLRVVGVSYSGRTIHIEFSEDLNTSTVSESDFAINDGLITFDHLTILDDHTVKFVADSAINGDENISVSGTIEDIYGIRHNDGIDAIYTFGE